MISRSGKIGNSGMMCSPNYDGDELSVIEIYDTVCEYSEVFDEIVWCYKNALRKIKNDHYY